MPDFSDRYRLLRVIGEGGMGVVHEAEDLRLGRRVAIKMIRGADADPRARARFLREARAAASLSHPNACQLYEIDEFEGEPFLVMELLSGQPLSKRLETGTVGADEAVDIILAVLRALGAMHACGLVHRDLKPSNIFLTPVGVKLLDFGLAQQVEISDADATQSRTAIGMVVGTPRYMSPEQLCGDPIDQRSDLYAAGLVLCELLTGHAELPEHSDAFATLAPVLRRALQRRPEMRYPNADAMAIELSAARGAAAQTAPPQIRLVVLPFQLIKDDPEIGFLGNALPEAITASLAGVRTILVRSNLAAARLGAGAGPIRAGVELDVNHVLTGTIHRAGPRLRVSCQLIEVPSERVAWSGVKEMPIGDLFELQDEISQHIVESLPIEGRDVEPARVDAKAAPRAYELFLRANQIAHDHSRWLLARTLYEECVAADPSFAPAWVSLGRINQLIGKYLEQDVHASYGAAADAFQRAFQLQPSLPVAHHQFAYLEVEQGHPDRALVRLVTQLRNRPNQPQLFAALCHVSRYCGLLDVSLAADAQARRLDPLVRSSVVNTHLLVTDYTSMLRASHSVADQLLAIARFELGERQEALAICRSEQARFSEGTIAHLFATALGDAFADNHAAASAVALFDRSGWFPDGELHFYVARLLSRSGEFERSRQALERAAERGFFASRAFERDPWLAPARQHEAGYAAIAALAADRHRAAVEIFDAVGGYELLGLKREPIERV